MRARKRLPLEQLAPYLLDVPPASAKVALFGSAIDSWEVPLADVGPTGDDGGKGGKYLFLPPGYELAPPAGGTVLEVGCGAGHILQQCYGLVVVPGANRFLIGELAKRARQSQKLKAFAVQGQPGGQRSNIVDVDRMLAVDRRRARHARRWLELQGSRFFSSRLQVQQARMDLAQPLPPLWWIQ